jgi:predicted methyltransferase
MRPFQPLTALAQDAVDKILDAGSLAIDATVGNGHDTLFLAGRVAPQGRVIGFDVQADAVVKTRARLVASQLDAVAEVHLCGHERMLEQVPTDWIGRVAAVMFNLGYLPGGDKTRITRGETTVAALDQALRLLRPRGLLSLLLYREHAGAQGESDAVLEWLDRLPATHRIERHESPGPVLFLVTAPLPPLSRCDSG